MKEKNKVSILRKSTPLKDGRVLQLWADGHMNNVLIIKDGNFYTQIGVINEKLNISRKRDIKKSIIWMFQSISFYEKNNKLKIKFIKENHVIIDDYENLNIEDNALTEKDFKEGFIVLGKPKKQSLKTRMPMNIKKIMALL